MNSFGNASSRRPTRTTLEVRLRQMIILLILITGAMSSYFIVIFFQQRNQPPHTYFEYQLATWKASLEQNPNNPDVLTNLGYLHIKMGQDGRGIGYLNSALKINPKFAPAHYNLGIYYQKQGEYTTAIPYLKKAATLSTAGLRYLAYFSLGESYEKLGKPEDALKAYNSSLEDNGSMWNSLYNVGMIYEKKGDLNLALEKYRKAAEFNKDEDKLLKAISRVEKKIAGKT